MSYRRLTGFLVALTAVAAACGNDADEPAAPADNGEEEAPEEAPAETTVVAVEGTSFEFDPSEIQLAEGDEFTVEFTADDVFHTFTVEELDIDLEASAGETTDGTFVAGESGEFVFYCTVPGHREQGMEGTIIVE